VLRAGQPTLSKQICNRTELMDKTCTYACNCQTTVIYVPARHDTFISRGKWIKRPVFAHADALGFHLVMTVFLRSASTDPGTEGGQCPLDANILSTRISQCVSDLTFSTKLLVSHFHFCRSLKKLCEMKDSDVKMGWKAGTAEVSGAVTVCTFILQMHGLSPSQVTG
jgi:hypothetical protein